QHRRRGGSGDCGFSGMNLMLRDAISKTSLLSLPLLLVLFNAAPVLSAHEMSMSSQQRSTKPTVNKQPFGTADGQPIDIYTLTNAHGIEMRVTNFGGLIVSLRVPDKSGKLDDVVLGFDTLDGYLENKPHFGALVGRYANRIANGEFKLDGVTYQLARN